MQEEHTIEYHHSFTGSIFVSFCVLLIYVASGPIFKNFRFHYIHESGICMVIGFSVALIARMVEGKANGVNSFKEDIFFNFILPPIVFNAGYTMKKQTFFKYSLYILVFGIFSTIVSFLTVFGITHFLNENQMFSYTNEKNSPLLFTLTEVVLFSVIICATDSVAALTFINDNQEPKLHAILFGEGVINDVVCIVLYKIISSQNKNVTLDLFEVSQTIATFFWTFSVSLLLGIAFGSMLCLFLRFFRQIKPNKEQEICIIFIFAMISYSFSEYIGQSPILALLFTGIVASHYGYYNLDYQSSQESVFFLNQHLFQARFPPSGRIYIRVFRSKFGFFDRAKHQSFFLFLATFDYIRGSICRYMFSQRHVLV